jgi:hypothetical protein
VPRDDWVIGEEAFGHRMHRPAARPRPRGRGRPIRDGGASPPGPIKPQASQPELFP